MMQNIKQLLQAECYGRDLEQRRHWYSAAALAYQQTRPRYPQVLIDRVIEITRLSANSTLLEVGCGPAIATPAFAELECQMVCVEPNPDFYHLAQQTCASYVNVALQNCSFEEWELIPQSFDAVLAASSFHWVSPEIGYPKAAAALKPEGFLILLWNKELQPTHEVYQQLSPVYATHAPSLMRQYEDHAMQKAILDEMGQMAIDSEYFKDMVSGHFEVEVTYSIDQYLTLLNTYSPHLKLEAEQKQALFSGLREVLAQQGETIDLTFTSAFHITRSQVIEWVV